MDRWIDIIPFFELWNYFILYMELSLEFLAILFWMCHKPIDHIYAGIHFCNFWDGHMSCSYKKKKKIKPKLTKFLSGPLPHFLSAFKFSMPLQILEILQKALMPLALVTKLQKTSFMESDILNDFSCCDETVWMFEKISTVTHGICNIHRHT